MKRYKNSPLEIFRSLYQNRQLIKSLIKREVIGRYKGTNLGIIWSVLLPLLMLLIYTFVFGSIFQSKWPGIVSSTTSFALMLFSGLMIFNVFSEVVNRAPNLILTHPNYVTKIVFPLEILGFVVIGSAVFNCFISYFIWVVAYIFLFGIPSVTIVIFPLILIPFLFFCLGILWALSALGVYFRDLSQIIGALVTILMFLSPVFYAFDSVPENYKFIVKISPLTPVIEATRNILFWGLMPSSIDFLLYFAFSMIVCFSGFAIFQNTRKGFSDVI